MYAASAMQSSMIPWDSGLSLKRSKLPFGGQPQCFPFFLSSLDALFLFRLQACVGLETGGEAVDSVAGSVSGSDVVHELEVDDHGR